MADENLSGSGAALLRAAGHDVTTVLEQGLGGVTDPRLAAICRSAPRGCTKGVVLTSRQHDAVVRSATRDNDDGEGKPARIFPPCQLPPNRRRSPSSPSSSCWEEPCASSAPDPPRRPRHSSSRPSLARLPLPTALPAAPSRASPQSEGKLRGHQQIRQSE